MLGFCRDPFITQLNRLGFTLMPLAEAGIAPLDVYGRQGRELFRLGNAAALFVAGEVPLPNIEIDIPAAELRLKKTAALDAGLGVALMSEWLGHKNPEVSEKISRSNKFQFELKGVVKDRVDLDPLDRFLKTAHLHLAGPMLRRMLDGNEVYITTTLLKARSMSLSSHTKLLSDGHATIPETEALPVGVKASVKLSSKNDNELEFKAAKPLVFAIQAVQVCLVNGIYKTIRVERSGMQLMSDKGLAAVEKTETGWLCDQVGTFFPRFAPGFAAAPAGSSATEPAE
jgi:hypothetical protein